MSHRWSAASTVLHKIVRASFSIPLYCKILGIGVLVAALFGAVTAYHINYATSSKLYDSLENEAVTVGRLVADFLSKPLVVDDLSGAREIMQRVMGENDEIRYIEVLNPDCQTIIGQSAGGGKEHHATLRTPGACREHSVSVWRRDAKIIVESRTPVLEGQFGIVRVGMSDARIVASLNELNRSFFWALLVCAILGQVMALVVAYFLTHPIHQLVNVAGRLSNNDLTARATVFCDDEIGGLARAFNSMAENLEHNNNLIQAQEQARALLVKKVVTRGEDERRFVARELHDELGQSLSSLLMQTESWDCHNTEKTCQHRDQFAQFVRRLIDDVRHMAFAIRPAVLDDYGLGSALERFVDDIQKRSDLCLDYQHIFMNESKRMPAEVETMLYRIAQEAVSNIIRHARAESASIILVQHDDKLTMVIEDNGVGFEPGHTSHGLGLVGMRERTVLLDGTLLVESERDRGTTIKVNVPLGGEEMP